MNQRPTQSVHGAPLLEYVEWGESFDQAMSPLMNPKTTSKDHTAAVAEAYQDATPTLVWWGPDFQQSANAAAVTLLGEAHIPCMGGAAEGCWSEVWDLLAPTLIRSFAHPSTEPWRVMNVPIAHHADTRQLLSLNITPITVTGRVGGFSVQMKGSHTYEGVEPRVDYTRRSMVLIDADSVSRAELATAIGEFGTPLQSFADITSIEGSKNLFDLVILGPGSIEISSCLVKQVRTVDPSACLPIVLIGTVACLAGMTQALLAGADDYVAWPCSREVLRARMEGLLAARLRSEFALMQATDRVKHLERALDSNRVIGTALGILMATQKITSEEAFMCLKRASQHSNRKLREIAEDVIYTGALTEMA